MRPRLLATIPPLLITAIPLVCCAHTWEATTDSALTYALFSAANGDRVHIPGPATITASASWVIKTSIEVYGDGRGTSESTNATVLTTSGNFPILTLDPSLTTNGLEHVYIHDLQILGPWSSGGQPYPTSNGIHFDNSTPTGKHLSYLRLQRLLIKGMANDGIDLIPAGGSAYVIAPHIMDCVSEHNYGYGLRISNTTVAQVQDCGLRYNGLGGARITGANEPQILSTTLESNGSLADQDAFRPRLFLETAHAFDVEGCHFEGIKQGLNAKTAITVVGSWGGQISSNTFSGSGISSKGIYICAGAPPGPVNSITIGPNMYFDVDTLVRLDDSPNVTGCVIAPQAVYGSPGVASKLIVPEATDRGNIVMPATRTGTKGGASYNTTAGIEFPRLSSTTRDLMTDPASGGNRREGLVIYNDTAKRLQNWNGTRWMEGIVSPSGSELNLL